MTTTKTVVLPKSLAGITHEIIMITPAVAEQLLGYNDSNRESARASPTATPAT